MNKLKTRRLPIVLGLASLVGALPAGASTTTFAINGVSNANINCASGINCQRKLVERVQCPPGEEAVSVSVTLGPSLMDSDISANNTAQNPACYNVESLTHDALHLSVPDASLILNGGAGSSGGSGTTGTDNCSASWEAAWKPWRAYLGIGESYSANNVVVTNKGPLGPTVIPADDPRFSVFYGVGQFNAEFSAQATERTTKSGTFEFSVVTNATSQLIVTPSCETAPPPPPPPPPPVPAIGALGIGFLGFGLSGLGLLGLRRRRP